MHKTIIGLFGPPRAGKNEVVKRLLGRPGYVHLSISQAMKNLSHKAAGQVYTDAEKDVPQRTLQGRRPRDLYIQFGQMDEFVPAIWTDIVIDQILRSEHSVFVIESIGKQQQFNRMLEMLGGHAIHLIEVQANYLVNGQRFSPQWDTRGPIKDYNTPYVISNDGSPDDLDPQVRTFLEAIPYFVPRDPTRNGYFLTEQGWRFGDKFNVAQELFKYA